MARHEPVEDEIVSGVRKRRQRWLRSSNPTLAGQLARVGVLGWIVVVPTLLGAWLGGWLDRLSGGGIVWSGALLSLGLALGCWSAWKWMHAP